MQIAVSLTFDLEASQNLDEVETLILETGRAAMRKALELAVREVEESVRACRACGGETLVEGSESRLVLATFGRVVLRLRRLVCLKCGQSFRPAEGFLSCLEGANVSGKLRAAAVLAGSSWPYETAASVLRDLCGAEISHETIRRVTNAAGREEVSALLAEARQVVEPSLEGAKAEEERDLEARLAAKGEPKGPGLLLVGLDGGWIPSRDTPGGMEGKVGVVATDPLPIGRAGRHRLGTRRYVASFAGSKELGLLAYAAASELGAERARQQVVLGDGAEWIKTETKAHFPEALTILDWAHVARSVHRAIRCARPGKAFRTVRASLHQSVADLLWHGRVDEALGCLRGLRPWPEAEGGQEAGGKDVEPVKALEEAIEYLELQRAWIGNYQALQEQGYPVGSGMVEREVELVINRRLKRQGMRWRRENADAVATLRTSTINSTWKDPANQPPQPQAA